MKKKELNVKIEKVIIITVTGEANTILVCVERFPYQYENPKELFFGTEVILPDDETKLSIKKKGSLSVIRYKFWGPNEKRFTVVGETLLEFNLLTKKDGGSDFIDVDIGSEKFYLNRPRLCKFFSIVGHDEVKRFDYNSLCQ